MIYIIERYCSWPFNVPKKTRATSICVYSTVLVNVSVRILYHWPRKKSELKKKFIKVGKNNTFLLNGCIFNIKPIRFINNTDLLNMYEYDNYYCLNENCFLADLISLLKTFKLV